jgi:hypothetical protein
MAWHGEMGIMTSLGEEVGRRRIAFWSVIICWLTYEALKGKDRNLST